MTALARLRHAHTQSQAGPVVLSRADLPADLAAVLDLAEAAIRGDWAPAGRLSRQTKGERMRVYLASQYRRRAEMFGYLCELEAEGFEVPARWVRGLHGDENRTEYTREERAHFAREDLEDLKASRVAVFFTEEPYSKAGRGGRHVEYGYVLALGITPIVIGYLENVFHCLPEAVFVHDWPAAKVELRRLAREIGTAGEDGEWVAVDESNDPG